MNRFSVHEGIAAPLLRANVAACAVAGRISDPGRL